MKYYAIIDQIKNGDQFEDIFYTAENALDRAEYEWDQLTEHDKNRREFYIVVECELDEYGCVDMNTARVLKTLK